jgi:hypothetical protein
LLPYLDQQAIYERWNFTLPYSSAGNVAISQYSIPVLACPNDDSAQGVDGGLTYVANCGVGDADVDALSMTPATPAEVGHTFAVEPLGWADGSASASVANAELGKETGVFWADFRSHFRANSAAPYVDDATSKASVKIGRIYDGAGNTIMFTENVNAGKDVLTGASTWADPSIRSCGFFFGVDSGSPATFGQLQNITFTPPAARRLSANRFINQEKNGVDGGAPFPNSRHIGIVVASFCDGTVRTLTENLDRSVYVRLITPGAARPRTISGFVAEQPLGGNDF